MKNKKRPLSSQWAFFIFHAVNIFQILPFEFQIKSKTMFGFLKKKSPLEKLTKEYQSLMEEAFRLSKTDRKSSDQKYAEAEEIQKKIEALKS